MGRTRRLALTDGLPADLPSSVRPQRGERGARVGQLPPDGGLQIQGHTRGGVGGGAYARRVAQP